MSQLQRRAVLLGRLAEVVDEVGRSILAANHRFYALKLGHEVRSPSARHGALRKLALSALRSGDVVKASTATAGAVTRPDSSSG